MGEKNKKTGNNNSNNSQIKKKSKESKEIKDFKDDIKKQQDELGIVNMYIHFNDSHKSD